MHFCGEKQMDKRDIVNIVHIMYHVGSTGVEKYMENAKDIDKDIRFPCIKIY